MSETKLTAADVVEAIRTLPLTVNDRITIIRAMRDSMPGLLPVDPVLSTRIRAAQAVPSLVVNSTANALENSEVWQASSATTASELRGYLQWPEENRPFIDEVQALGEILLQTSRHYHYLAVDKARQVYRTGKEMRGDARLAIQPHLNIIADSRPPQGRRRRKPEPPAQEAAKRG